ncbi:MAG: Crp/Fnr family transcriptional regulator [Ruminococcaceae bacterium]|nr:Crp/Fnr family transcriptional regulator [Oscillospiraceae bacterium]
MNKYIPILARCPLFSGISEEDLLRMLDCLGAKTETFDKKYTIFAEGSPAKYIGIVLSGKVQVEQTDYYGNRSILSMMGPSEVFAEAFACAEIPVLPVSVIASEACEIMYIECSHILYTCANNCGFHRQLIFNLMRDLAEKTISFHRRIDVTSKRTTREKLMAYLMHCAKAAGTDTFEIPFDRQALADYLEVDRSGLSTEIGKLTREGVIIADRKKFTLL